MFGEVTYFEGASSQNEQRLSYEQLEDRLVSSIETAEAAREDDMRRFCAKVEELSKYPRMRAFLRKVIFLVTQIIEGKPKSG